MLATCRAIVFSLRNSHRRSTDWFAGPDQPHLDLARGQRARGGYRRRPQQALHAGLVGARAELPEHPARGVQLQLRAVSVA
jgi:hypothetical protein